MEALANRGPYAVDAKKIMEKCAAREITGILAAHSIPNLCYILRKNFSQEERRFLSKNLCKIFQISNCFFVFDNLLICVDKEYLTTYNASYKKYEKTKRRNENEQFFE